MLKSIQVLSIKDMLVIESYKYLARSVELVEVVAFYEGIFKTLETIIFLSGLKKISTSFEIS